MTELQQLELLRAAKAARDAGDDAALLAALRALKGESAPAPAPSPAQPLYDAASGVTRGLTGFLDTFVGNPLAGLANTMGAGIGYNPIGTAANMVGLGLPAQTPGGQFVQRVGEEVGASMVPGAGLLGVAPKITSGLLAPMAQRVAQAPAAYAAGELGSAVASGTGAAVANEVAPGNRTAEMVGQMAGALAPTGAAMAVRGMAGVNPADVAAMQRAGVQPTVGQTGNTGMKVIEGGLRAAPGSTGILADVAERQAQQLGSGVDDIARRMAGSVGEESAGRAVEQGFRGFVGRAQQRAGTLWQKLDQAIPRDTPVTIGNTRRVLDDLTGKGALSKVFASPTIARAAKAVEAAGDAVPYSELRELRSFIGAKLGSPDLISDIPRGELKRLYSALSQDVKAAASSVGALADFERANRYTRALHQRAEATLEPILRRTTPERIFRAVRNADASTLRGIRRSLKPSEWRQVVGAVVSDLGTANASRQSAAGDVFSPETFLTQWNRLKPEVRRVMFTGPGFESFEQDLDAVARAASLMRDNAAVLANPSGTGRAVANASAISGGLAALASGNAGLAGAVAGGALGTNLSARLMSSPRFVNWLAQTTRAPTERIPTLVGRISTAMAGEPEEMKAEAVAFARALMEAMQ